VTKETDLTIEYVERRAKFKKRAEYNLNRKVLDGFKQLTRCANRRIYAYDEEQVSRLLLELKQGLGEVERAFHDAGGEGAKWVEL
jgi:hypothetical protein